MVGGRLLLLVLWLVTVAQLTPLAPTQPPLNAPQGTVHKQFDIINIDRSALGRVAGAIARQHGDKGFAGTIQLTLTGSGGQSFGCFNIQVCVAVHSLRAQGLA